MAVVLAAFIASPASAAIIFQDNFNRANSDTVGNGWVELEDDSNDVRVKNSTLRLRDTLSGEPDAAASQLGGLSSLGIFNITLSYDWARLNDESENSDKLHVEWKLTTDSSWNNLATHSLGGGSSLKSETVSLGSGAENVNNLQIRFWTDVSTSKEGAKIDNVVLSGNYVYVAVPEPGTLVLFGLGILGIGYLGWRRRG